jgi:hypothetical protein
MATSSLGSRSCAFPPLCLVNHVFWINTCKAEMKHFDFCLWEPGSLVDNDVLLLVSLTTSHREAGLPTSTGQRGGLREVGVRVWSLGLRSGDHFSTKHGSRRQKASSSLGVVSSGRRTLRLALRQTPEHVEGEE